MHSETRLEEETDGRRQRKVDCTSDCLGFSELASLGELLYFGMYPFGAAPKAIGNFWTIGQTTQGLLSK